MKHYPHWDGGSWGMGERAVIVKKWFVLIYCLFYHLVLSSSLAWRLTFLAGLRVKCLNSSDTLKDVLGVMLVMLLGSEVSANSHSPTI